MAAEAIDYAWCYPFASRLRKLPQGQSLELATGSDVLDFPYFLHGRLLTPHLTAQQLLLVSRVAGARFYMPPSMLPAGALLADPVVTSGAGKLRFEAFSQCCGVYCRLDLLSTAIDGTFMRRGTTNVDFNRPMCDALAGIRPTDRVLLSVGRDRVELETDDQRLLERQVDLPRRWYKGFVEVQSYAAAMQPVFEVSGPIACRFLQGLAQQVPAKSEGHLVLRQNGLNVSRRPLPNSIPCGGIERLRPLHAISHHALGMRFYTCTRESVLGCEMLFPESRLLVIASPHACRGFSGEGQAISHLLRELDEKTLEELRRHLEEAEQLSFEALAAETKRPKVDLLTAVATLGSRGLIGYDLHDSAWFYRQLPFRPEQVDSMHPRLEAARALVDQGLVEVLSRSRGSLTEAYVQGSGVKHRVRELPDGYRCTCAWFTRHQGKRGPCKHILAVRLQDQDACRQ